MRVYATEQLQVQNIDNIERWCFLIGHLDRETALKGLDQLSFRNFNKEEYLKILSTLVIGLSYIMEPTLSLGGVLDEKRYHPATPEFSNWLIDQDSHFEFNVRELIRVLNDISAISPGKIEHDIEALMDAIVSSFDPSNEEDGEESDFEWAIGSGFRFCEREKIQLSESCLMRIILLKRHNLMNSALGQLLKIANKNTAETLINFHNDLPSGHRRGMVLDTIEKLSSRFGFKVIDVDGALQVAIQ